MFFDDFRVEHVKSPVIQMDDYYPFGLTFNSYRREDSMHNKFKFQGQEHNDDLNLGWDSFKWRNHQPEIGRFFNIDPLAQKYYYNSPYAFSENKVVGHIELEGLEAVEAALLLAKYSIIMNNMNSTSSQGALTRVVTNSSNTFQNKTGTGQAGSLADTKPMATLNDTKIVADATAKNTKVLANEVSKDG